MKKLATIIFSGMIAAGALTGALAGCGQQPANGQSGAESEGANNAAIGDKVLTCGSTGYFGMESMDPANSYDGWYWQFSGVLETLFQLDANYVPQNSLIDSYKNVDPLTWEFTIKDVTFHNGSKVTAEAVKKCFERTLEKNSRAKEQIYFDSITADGQTLTIKTKQENLMLLNDLCDPVWVVYDTEGSDFSKNLYGTGPYKVDAFEAGVETTATRFDNYWGGTPKLDKVVLKTVGDTDSLTMALQKGEIDLAAALPSSSMPVFQGKSDFVIDAVPCARANAIYFNLERPAVKDKIVRNAISMSIDRQGIVDHVYSGMADVSYGIFPSLFSYGGTEGLNPTVSKYDPDAAAKMLKDAGYADTNGNGILDKDGVELSLRVVTTSSRKELAQFGEILRSQLKEIGIEMKLDVLESSTDVENSGDFDLSIRTFGMAPTGNAQYYFNTHLLTGASNNVARFSNTKFDDLAKQLETTYETADRDKIIKEMSQILLDDVPVIVYSHQKFACVYNNKVTGFETQPSEYYLIDANVTLK